MNSQRLEDFRDDADYGSIIRNNLMKSPGYSPYCASSLCPGRWPRTYWDGDQFQCPSCNFRTSFNHGFISTYKERRKLFEAMEVTNVQLP